nr:MAG TPA: hypothetical protein [Crassvirales sp.]
MCRLLNKKKSNSTSRSSYSSQNTNCANGVTTAAVTNNK